MDSTQNLTPEQRSAIVPRRSGIKRTYRWRFNPQFGPEFAGPTGRAVTKPNGALWRAFESWHTATFTTIPKKDKEKS